MRLPDRFACRREGHKPALSFSKIRMSPPPPDGEPFRYFTTCLVCGQWYEQEVPVEPAEAS